MLLLLALFSLHYSKNVYLSPSGSDDNSGEENSPFQSISVALDATSAGDVLIFLGGNYVFSSNEYFRVNHKLTIKGENNPNITRGGFIFNDSFQLSGITMQSVEVAIKIDTSEGQVVDGVKIFDCQFFGPGMEKAIISNDEVGEIKNVEIYNNLFKDYEHRWVSGVEIVENLISFIHIHDNQFINLLWSTEVKSAGSSAIVIGQHAKQTTHTILIENNYFENIQGCSETQGEEDIGYETHGIIGYGTFITVRNNEIIDVNEGEDHEAIYFKSQYSTFLNNKIRNGGSGDGDLTIKGGVYTQHVIIARNIILSSQQGRGILLYGGGTIDGNYIKKPLAERSGVQSW